VFFKIKKKDEGEMRKVRILIKKRSEEKRRKVFFKIKKRMNEKGDRFCGSAVLRFRGFAVPRFSLRVGSDSRCENHGYHGCMCYCTNQAQRAREG